MSTTNIVMLDPHTNQPVRVIDDADVVWSSAANVWGGVTLERYAFDGIETPEFAIADHAVSIQLSPRVEVEERIAGNFKKRISPLGNTWLFSAGAPRQGRTHGRLELLMITLSSDAIARAATDSRRQSSVELTEHHDLTDPQIEHIALALKAEVESGYESGRLYGESLCLALSAHLVARYSAIPQIIRAQTGGISPASLRRVIEYIVENLTSDLRLAELAEIAGLSQYRFCHNFKRSTGLAPHQYVIQKRMELAKQLLRETNAPVIDIAYAVGCGSPGRFAMLFRRTTGSTPSSYRASL